MAAPNESWASELYHIGVVQVRVVNVGIGSCYDLSSIVDGY